MPESQADDRPIWARPEPATRQPRFSRDQIAAAALSIADAEGFDAVTMRRIARALGAGTMSLYRYIATRSDLLALLDNALLGESLVPGELPGDWKQAVAMIARQSRQTFLRHPWAVQVLQGDSAGQAGRAGPNGMRHLEQWLAALERAPMSTAAKLDFLAIVDDYVTGHIVRAAELPEMGDEASAISQLIDAELASGRFPHLAALAGDPAITMLRDSEQLADQFELGLRLLIDGIGAEAAREQK